MDRMKTTAGIGAIAVGLLLAPATTAPATALNADPGSYSTCLSDLTAAGLATDLAAEACAGAFHPRQLASCVTRLEDLSELTATERLSACSRDRRPDDLASCVIDITDDLGSSTAPEALDSCRLSLLPQRFANCVVGVSAAGGLDAIATLDLCLQAGYRPRDLAPSFLPAP
jgi:hypothetical protein